MSVSACVHNCVPTVVAGIVGLIVNVVVLLLGWLSRRRALVCAELRMRASAVEPGAAV